MTANLRDICPRYAGRGMCLYDNDKPCSCREIEETFAKAFESVGVALNMRVEADAALVRDVFKSFVEGVARAAVRSALDGTLPTVAQPGTSA